MPTVKLTQTYINNLPVPEKAYWILDEVISGLRLYVGKYSKTYYLKYKNAKGKSDTFKIGDEKLFTPIQAREAAKKFLAEMAIEGTDIKRERKKEQLPTIRELAEKYLSAGGSKVTYSIVMRLTNFIDRASNDITPLELTTWRVKEKERTGNKDCTLNKKITSLQAILNFGVRNELIPSNPIASVSKLKEVDSKKKTRYLTVEEMKRLLEALDRYDDNIRAERARSRQHSNRLYLPSMEGWAFANYFKPVIILSLNTGIRRHALLSLRWEDVDLDKGNVTLRADTAKSKKSDIIPLNTVALNTLRQWRAQRLDDNPLVFPSPKTGGVMDNCDKSFSWLLKEADIANFTWHDMRHSFASQLVMAGVDLNTVRELMTHSDLKMTLRYAHLAPEKKRAAVELIAN